jgi:class 3 adenylate cyclase
LTILLQVMREGIAKHGGYEINTEGDAFQVAFTSVHQVDVLLCSKAAINNSYNMMALLM